jgi:HK97 gp10 family phage protein
MSERDDMKAQIAAMKKKFAERAAGVHGGLYKAVSRACLLIEAEAKREMTEAEINGERTYYRGKHHRIAHNPSVPGSAPAVDLGTLRQSVTHDVTQDGSQVTGRVGSTIVNPPYGAYLEYGTSRMAARPWLGPAYQKNKDTILSLIGAAACGRDVSLGLEGPTLGVEASDATG